MPFQFPDKTYLRIQERPVAFTVVLVRPTGMAIGSTSSQDFPHSLADAVQFLRSTFVEGGVPPRLETRTFTRPLKIGQYIKVVCPLDHPATEQTP